MNRPLTALTVALSLSLASCSREQPPAPYAVEEVPLSQVAEDLASGKTTAVAVTQAYIDRINMFDGPLNGVIAIAPDALQQAAASDTRRKEGKSLGPLDGVPILLKDNIDAVGMPTTAGSWALERNMPAKDAPVTARLRAAGAVILGKANTSQFAGFRTATGLNGSTLGGSTHNPYDVKRTAAGSSNGSGISASASFAAGTIGTETSGSIVGPSNVNGVVGLKSTIALVPRTGIVPISLTQDMAGPMTRTVRDAAMILNVIAGSDAGDPWSKDADANKKDYVAALTNEGLKGKRLGVIRLGRHFEDAKNVAVFEEALATMRAQGAELVEIPNHGLVNVGVQMGQILIADFKEDLNAYLAGTNPEMVKVRTLADVIEFNKTDPRESMHAQEAFTDSEATVGGRSNPEYQKVLAEGKRLATVDGLDRVLRENNVQAIVSLTGGPASEITPDGSTTGPAGWRNPEAPPSLTALAALAGYPHLSVPAGQVDGLPIGVSFLGAAWTEAELFSMGYAYEQASKKRVPPKLVAPPPAGN
ncbi:MAG: amidase [Rhodospirillaceae bacterium]